MMPSAAPTLKFQLIGGQFSDDLINLGCNPNDRQIQVRIESNFVDHQPGTAEASLKQGELSINSDLRAFSKTQNILRMNNSGETKALEH
jgi:hypothetical protein